MYVGRVTPAAASASVNRFNLALRFYNYMVFIKNCVFSQFTATHPLHVGEQLILSECTVILNGWQSVQPIAALCWRGKCRKILKILEKKTQYLMNTLYKPVIEMRDILFYIFLSERDEVSEKF